jgi:hypothetical protein
LNVIDNPDHFLVKKGLAIVGIDKTDFHPGRKMVIHYGPIHFFEVFGHGITPF